MKPAKQDWEYSTSMKSDARSLRLRLLPMPDAIDLDAVISVLEDLSEHLSRRRQELPAAVQGKGSCRSRSHQRASFSRDWPALPSKLEWPDRGPTRPLSSIARRVSLGSWRQQMAKVDAIRRKETTMAHNLIKAKISALACLPTKVRSIRLRIWGSDVRIVPGAPPL